MATLTGNVLADDAVSITWTAECRVEGRDVTVEWIRARSADQEFNTHWPVGHVFADALSNGEYVGLVTATIEQRVIEKYQHRHRDRRHP